MRFVDTDELAAELDGRSVQSIFAEDSEAGFRSKEAEAIAQSVRLPGAVIATGGGAVVDPANTKALQSAGVIVYLKVSPDVAAARVGDGAGRPLLAAGDVNGTLEKLIAVRGPVYEAAADLTVDGAGEVDQVALAIIDAIAGAASTPKRRPEKSEPAADGSHIT